MNASSPTKDVYLRQREDDTGKYPSNTEVEERGVAVDLAGKEGGEEDEHEADMTTCNLKDQEANLIASEFCEQRDCECTLVAMRVTCAYVHSWCKTPEGWLLQREGAGAGN